MKRFLRLCAAGTAAMAVAAAIAAVSVPTIQQFGRAINVSHTVAPTEKAKAVRLAYVHAGSFRKAWLATYVDGQVGQQNVYARASFDEGATWSAPVLLSRDAANAPTGGQSITTAAGLAFVADNEKPSLFAPPTTSGPAVVLVWNSAYCPQDPSGQQAGHYVSPVQGTGDLDQDGTLDRPFHCEWMASSTDPSLAVWDVQQLTDGRRDAFSEVVAGNATGTAFAMAWQEDPAGLQPGEAEGPGDGGSGARVSSGTNIWYTHARLPSATELRANIAQLSNNDSTGIGQPGASRANLQISGSTAVLAYEETACPGGTAGKCIVYHSFPYASNDTDSPGTIVSDVTHNARRVRLTLQGAAAAGASPLRSVLVWRESVSYAPGAPADISMRRGLVNPQERPGSTGMLASDILADMPQRMTDLAATGGNANAQRAVVRGGTVALAYDSTPDMAGADPKVTPEPTANYNLFFTSSADSGAPGSWTTARNLSGVAQPSVNAVEPRLVPTPGTIVNPLTGVPDAGDVQDANVFYISYGTQSNDAAELAGRVFVSRSTDQGATFEPFMPVSMQLQGQSEAQLRPTPGGSSVTVLWMDEQTPGDASTKDAVYAVSGSVERPDLVLLGKSASFVAGGEGTLNFLVRNTGGGHADPVSFDASLPAGLIAHGVSGAATCGIAGQAVHCVLADIAPGQTAVISLTVASDTLADYAVSATVASATPDMAPANNTVMAEVSAVAPDNAAPEPAASQGGGGCSSAGAGQPFDPLWPVLSLGAALALLRRSKRRAVSSSGSNG